MAALIRKKMFYNRLRQLHTSTDGSGERFFGIKVERKAFLDVLPEVINSVVTGPKLTELPEVRSWIKKVSAFIDNKYFCVKLLEIARYFVNSSSKWCDWF